MPFIGIFILKRLNDIETASVNVRSAMRSVISSEENASLENAQNDSLEIDAGIRSH